LDALDNRPVRFLRNQLHEKMAAMQQALEALATPRATPELQAERPVPQPLIHQTASPAGSKIIVI